MAGPRGDREGAGDIVRPSAARAHQRCGYEQRRDASDGRSPDGGPIAPALTVVPVRHCRCEEDAACHHTEAGADSDAPKAVESLVSGRGAPARAHPQQRAAK